MVMTYRRPGVYLEESLLVNPRNTASSTTVGAFVGVAEKGPTNVAVAISSWNDYAAYFGGFGPISATQALGGTDPLNVTSVNLPTASTFATLAALKASVTMGDTHYSGPAFTTGQYVILGDSSHARYQSTAWVNIATVFNTTQLLSYLPYAVYSFYQNGGRMAYIVRSAPTAVEDGVGKTSSMPVIGAEVAPALLTSFKINAKSVGSWGNKLTYSLTKQSTVLAPDPQSVFAIQVQLQIVAGTFEVVETFTGLSVTGNLAGTRRVDAVINDAYAGSRYITISEVNGLQPQPEEATTAVALVGGVDPGIPTATALAASVSALASVEGPLNLNICGYSPDASNPSTGFVGTLLPSSSTVFANREDVMIINDFAKPRLAGDSSSEYADNISTSTYLGANSDSYTASYGPWITIPDPQRVGATIDIPPGGAVIGMMARIDATVGVFRAPAGVIAGLNNAVGVQTKFTETELGDLNNKNINIIRSVVGAGVCVMGARTRKTYGADRYVSARRMLIFIKESLKRSTQWAVFENNDQRLWSGMRMTADSLLRPIWEAGGLAGGSSAEAYQIVCDASINTPAVIQSGEVRMEIGVALEYPAEFVVIRITQYDRGSISSTSNLTAF